MLILFAFVVFIIIIALKDYRFKWRTFFRKGFSPKNDRFGVYVYCGKQGKGKTYSVVEFLIEQSKKGIPIYANLKSLDPNLINYTYFETIDQLLNNKEEDCIIVFDEIFSIIEKGNKLDKRVMRFLSQMRKRRNIFVTTAQEWLEINLTLRRYTRYQIQCNMIDLPLIGGISIKSFYDAELMVFDKDVLDFVAPLDTRVISKCNIKVANSYDTYEQIFNS